MGGGELHGEVVDAFLLFLNDTNRVSERAWAFALSLFCLPFGGPEDKQQFFAIYDCFEIDNCSLGKWAFVMRSLCVWTLCGI